MFTMSQPTLLWARTPGPSWEWAVFEKLTSDDSKVGRYLNFFDKNTYRSKEKMIIMQCVIFKNAFLLSLFTKPLRFVPSRSNFMLKLNWLMSDDEKIFVFVCCKNWDLALLCFYRAPALPRQGWWSESHPRTPSNSSQFQSKINKNKLQIPERFQFPFLSAFGNYFYSEKEDKKFSLYFWCMVSDYQVILTNVYVYGSKVNDSTQISKFFISRYISVKSNDKRLWFRFSSFGRTTYKNNKQAKNTSRYNQTTTFWSENAFRKKRTH